MVPIDCLLGIKYGLNTVWGTLLCFNISNMEQQIGLHKGKAEDFVKMLPTRI